MELIWGVIVTGLSLLAWGGQAICALFPKLGSRWRLGESEVDVDPVFFVDACGEAIWNTLIL